MASQKFEGNSVGDRGIQIFGNTGPVSVVIHEALRDSLEELQVVEGAAFDSAKLEQEPLCLDGTRASVLAAIYAWAAHPKEKPLFWLNGMAGTGKSTIARTVARHLAEQGVLGGSFFFSRGDGDRVSAAKLLPTLAYQLGYRLPNVRDMVLQALRRKPRIEQKREQWKNFIVTPLSGDHSMLVFVIDALDECENQEDVRLMLQIFAELKPELKLRIFMTSRPDQALKFGFRMIGDMYEQLALHEAFRDETDRDLALFLRYGFDYIKVEREMPEDWPSKEEFSKLCVMAQGLFIFASTALRFVNDPDFLPDEQLSILLDEASGVGMLEQLDLIYATILNRSLSRTPEKNRGRVTERFKKVVGSVIMLFQPLAAEDLANLLFMRKQETLLALEPLGAVLAVPKEGPVRVLHPSFRDFLLRGADASFRIGNQSHVLLAETSIRLMGSLKMDICDLKHTAVTAVAVSKHIPPELAYACSYWLRHVDTVVPNLVGEEKSQMVHLVYNFLRVHFLHWLEALGLLKGIREVIPHLATLHSLFQGQDQHIVVFVRDVYRFTTYHCSAIERAPLQVYSSALIFSPECSVRKHFSEIVPVQLSPKPKVEDGWSPLLQTIEGSRPFLSVAFSPRDQMAAGSRDESVRIWDARTGILQHRLEGQGEVLSVCFSPTGDKVASGHGYPDHNVRVWDTASGVLLNTLVGHSSRVYAVAFSRDIVVSASGDTTARIWQSSGALLNRLEGHPTDVRSVSFAPDGDQFATASVDGTIIIWSTAGKLLRKLKAPGHVWSVVYLPKDNRLALAMDRTVQIWDASAGELLETVSGYVNAVLSLAFSPHGDRMASGSFSGEVVVRKVGAASLPQTLGYSGTTWSVAFSAQGDTFAAASDSTLRIYDAESPEIRPLEIHLGWADSVAFSPRGDRAISGSSDKTVRVWDTNTGESLHIMEHRDPVSAVAYSSQGDRIVATANKVVLIWNSETYVLLHTFETDFEQIWSVAFSHQGDKIVTGAFHNVIRVWDSETGATLRKFGKHGERIASVTFSPKGDKIVSGSYDKTVKIWEEATGELLHILQGHPGYVRSVAFSPDGDKLLSGCEGNIILVWDPLSGASLHKIKGHWGLVASAPGSLLSGMPLIDVQGDWIMLNGVKSLLLPENRRAYSVAVSGNKMIIGSKSGIVTIIGLNTRNENDD